MDFFTTDEFVDLARHCPELFGPDDPVAIEPITGETGSAEGYVNQVVRLRNQATGVTAIAKHALPFVRRAPEISSGLVLPSSRNRLEVALFGLWNTFTPGSAPRVHYCDPDRAVFVCDDMAQMSLVRFEFSRLHRYPHFGTQIGAFLARNAFHTSDWYLSARDRARLQRAYLKPDLMEMSERIYFDHPFFATNGEPRPAVLVDLLDEPRLRDEFIELRHLYMNRQESLAHSDFHTSNIFVGADGFAVIDGESAVFAPISYDLGMLIGNLMISCLSLQLRPDVTDAQRMSFEDHLIATVVGALDSYEATFRDLWHTRARPELRDAESYLDVLMTRTFREACGFAATQALALAHVPHAVMELRTLPEGPIRDHAVRLLGFTSVQVLLRRHELTRHTELGELLKAIKTAWRQVRGPAS